MACYVTFIAYGFPIVINDLETAGGPLFKNHHRLSYLDDLTPARLRLFLLSVFLRTLRFRSQNSIDNH